MGTPARTVPVAAIVALKTLPDAKSRMSALPAPLRERLARCMALDTIAAIARVVDEVVVISDQPDLSRALRRHGLSARVFAEPRDDGIGRPGGAVADGWSLNQALQHGDQLLRHESAGVVVACVGDLPALRPASVDAVVAASVGHRRAFLADRGGRGTTLLVARGVPLEPLYGSQIVGGRPIGSAERHRRSGAVPLPLAQLIDARCDVDTPADLWQAHRLGVGAATRSLLEPSTGQPGRLQCLEVVGRNATAIRVRADAATMTIPWAAYDGDPALVVPGRRLPGILVAGALSCWG